MVPSIEISVLLQKAETGETPEVYGLTNHMHPAQQQIQCTLTSKEAEGEGLTLEGVLRPINAHQHTDTNRHTVTDRHIQTHTK